MLNFKKFIEHFECLDRNQAQVRYGRVLKDYFNTKSNRDITIQTEYNNWVKTADYIRFWNTRSDSTILLKAGLSSAELISDITDKRIESLRSTIASSSSKVSDFQVSDSPNITTSSNTSSLATDSVALPVPNEPVSFANLTLHDIHNHLTKIRKSFLNEGDIKNHPWMYKDINISRLFNTYQIAAYDIVKKHGNLPIESYVHELASLTHIFPL